MTSAQHTGEIVMGWKSTVTVTRAQAIERIIDGLDEATNEQIAAALESLFGDSEGANYAIVPEVNL